MNKLSLLTTLTLLSSTLLFSSELHTWKACGADKNEALLNLSSTILANVQNSFTEKTTSSQDKFGENIDQRIDSILNISSDMVLVNQKFFKDANQTCVSVNKKDQIQNTQLLLTNVMLFKKENLPQDINKKILKVQAWLLDIKKVNNLVLAFFKPKQEYKNIESIFSNLKEKEKIFTDIYTNGILQANALVFKSCEDTKEDAYTALNKKLFKSKTKKKDDEGILDKASSFFSKLNIFSSDKEKMIDLFSKQVTYVQDDKKQCALIKKDELLDVAVKLNNNVSRFSVTSLSKNPKERYTQIKDYQEHLNVTKALIELFSDKFSNSDFTKITKTKKDLANELLTTYPQFVDFNIVGKAENIKIKLNDKFVKKNTKHYLKNGSYMYEITAKNKCPIKGSFDVELLKDKNIDEDFTSMNYPIINFYTKEGTRIIINGKNIKANVENTLKKCEGEVRYFAGFDGQSREGMITLSANMTKTIELKFLTSKELGIFNDAKTKLFKTTTKTAFSESLTPVTSKNLEFIVEDDCNNGKLELHERGSFTYTSNDKFVGVDSFKYIIKANREVSAPKVVNITVNVSNAPIAAVLPIKEVLNKDANLTTLKEKVIAVKEKVAENTEEELAKAEEKFQRFKSYVDSQELSIEKLKKIQEKYPDMFQRILKEKLLK